MLLERFFAAVRDYHQAREVESNTLDRYLNVARERDGQSFHPSWWQDKDRSGIWYPVMVPINPDPSNPFKALFRHTSDDAHAEHPPADARPALEAIKNRENWPWRNADPDSRGCEDTLKAWETMRQLLERSIRFANYILEHEQEVRVWVGKQRYGDSAYHLWVEFLREFKIRTGMETEDSLYKTGELKPALEAVLQSSNN